MCTVTYHIRIFKHYKIDHIVLVQPVLSFLLKNSVTPEINVVREKASGNIKFHGTIISPNNCLGVIIVKPLHCLVA